MGKIPRYKRHGRIDRIQKGTGEIARTLFVVPLHPPILPSRDGAFCVELKSFRFSSFRVILSWDVHILAGSPDAKEEFNMLYHSLIGDVDDLIFQDGWLISDR